MLHIIKNKAGLEAASVFLSSQDELILIEEASYLTKLCSESITERSFVLLEDLLARGINKEQVASCEVVDFSGFVRLTERHDSSLTWE